MAPAKEALLGLAHVEYVGNNGSFPSPLVPDLERIRYRDTQDRQQLNVKGLRVRSKIRQSGISGIVSM